MNIKVKNEGYQTRYTSNFKLIVDGLHIYFDTILVTNRGWTLYIGKKYITSICRSVYNLKLYQINNESETFDLIREV